MGESVLLLEQLHDELSAFKELPQIPWHQTNRAALIERLKAWHTHTKRTREIISLLQREQLMNPMLKGMDLHELERELSKNMDVLHRNIRFEEDKHARKIDLTQKITTPELGMELDARMHRQWLKLLRTQEHVQIALRNGMESPLTAQAMEGEIFSLIKTKDQELQSITKERDQLKREKYFGPHEKYSLTEMENDLQELLQTFAIQKHALKDHLDQGKKKLDEYAVQHEHLHHKTMKLEHLVTELTKRHIGILSVLKKERDFAPEVGIGDGERDRAPAGALFQGTAL
ncbi:MAG: hypothetical protein U1C71_00495, partial [archaeon]|nr:hypothetical protein [archaeon]